MWRARVAVVLPVVLVVGMWGGPAAGHVDGFVVTADAVGAVDEAAIAGARARVSRIVDFDSRWEVQSAGRSALDSDDRMAPVDFLREGGGFAEAVNRAAENDARNDVIIADVKEHSDEDSLAWLAADLASRGTREDKDAFVRSGLKRAQELDAAGVRAKREAVARQAREDRDFVAYLADHAPGSWLRAAANRAVTVGTDPAIAEFFRFGWATAAECDVQAFRAAVMDEEMRFRWQLDGFIQDAERAQRAYQLASGAARVKEAEVARSSWHAAADVAAAARVKWEAEQRVAATQARSWEAVRDHALAAKTQQDWTAIAAQAHDVSAGWDGLVTWSREQADDWVKQAASARASAEAVPAVG